MPDKKQSFNSGPAFFTAIVGFSVLFFLILIVFQIDYWVFDMALTAWLRELNSKYFIGTILIITLGSGPVLILLGRKYQRDLEQAMEEKILRSGKENNKADSGTDIPSGKQSVLSKAIGFTRQDSAFSELYQRFRFYLSTVSGEHSDRRRQAIDLVSGEQPGLLKGVYFPAAVVLLLLFQFVFIYFYFEARYRITPAEAIRFASREYPARAMLAAIFPLALIIWGLISYAIILRRDVLGFSDRIMEKTLYAGKALSMDQQYSRFIKSQWKQIRISPFRIYIRILLIMAIVPLSIGFLLPELNLLLIALGFSALALILWLIKPRGQADFQFNEAGWLRLREGNTKKDVSLRELVHIGVEYKPFRQNRSFGGDSGALLRRMAMKSMQNALANPVLVPAFIGLLDKNGHSYSLPLRALENETGEKVDSHEIEFFLAFWLKERGFGFKLENTREDAGSWKAEFTVNA
jgi:hypothetical protein